MGDVGSMVRIAKSKHVLAVFDSCFAGTVFSTQRARPPVAITRATARPVRQFLTSGDADQKVSDDGTFRTLFLRALKGEETADANRDGYLTGTELSFYLEDRITNLTRAAQTPRGGKLRDPRFDQGDFVFLLPQVAAAVVPETPAPSPAPTESSQAAFELTFWNAIQGSGNPADYQAYLETFPSGTFSRLAHNRLTELSTSQRPEEPSGTKLTVEPTTVAPEPQVAAVPPAAAPSEDLVGSYDGEWNLKLWVERMILNAAETRVFVTNGKFSAKISADGTRGTLSGKILSDGTLEGSGYLKKMGWSQRTFIFTARYQGGQFTAQGAAKTRGSPSNFRIVLTRPQQSLQ
jgi:hypothetical protein